MRDLYLTGGRQGSPRPLLTGGQGWYHYEAGVILRINLDSGEVERCVDYISPPEASGPGDPILFKAGSINDGRLYVCTQTEILIYALPHFERLAYFSLPCFNDIHHVLPTPDGNLLVANSGLEMVLELEPGGKVRHEWNVLGEDPWGRFSKEIDYRKGINLKPHRAHPNHLFYVGDEIWTTRFEQRDALCLTHPNRQLSIGLERVHDGVLHEGSLYFTTVNGYLVRANLGTLEVEETLDLNTLHSEDYLLGWCRGLLFDGDKVWIGFSHIRPTKFKAAVSWIRKGLRAARPTHIACYDLVRTRCLVEIDLEQHGMDAVFSILHAQ